jgi:large subunit ribosomal protein L18e
MASKTQTTNKVLFDTIRDLKKVSIKTGTSVFRAVADDLSASASQRAQVNLSRLERLTKDGEKVIVPGKVLGDGIFSKKITVIAFSASQSAIEKLEKAGSKFIEIKDYISKNPDSKVRIIK